MRKLMWFALGFTLACTIGTYLCNTWLFPAAVIGLSLSLFVLMLNYFAPTLRVVTAVLFGISLGFAVFSAYDNLYYQPVRAMDKQTQTAVIEVMDYPQKTDSGCSFDGRVYLQDKSYSIKAYLKDYAPLEPGDRVKGEFLFYSTLGKSQHYQSDGVLLVAYEEGVCVLQQYYISQFFHYPAIWRNQLTRAIKFSFSQETRGFALALLLGDKSGMDYETKTAFKESGISHIVAVSGLHVSILFGLVYLLCGKHRVFTALLGIPTVLLFAALTGFSPSIIRAAVMQILFMLALLLQREYDPLTALGFSALIMELGNPMVVSSVSFQLSMGCLIGILLFSTRIQTKLMGKRSKNRRWNKIRSWICSSVSVSLSAMIFTTPLVAYYYGTVSLVGVITNVCCLWVLNFVFLGILFCALIFFLSVELSQFIASVIGIPIGYVLWISKTLSKLPLSAVYTKSIYIVLWLGFIYCLFGLSLLFHKKSVGIYCGLAVVSLALAVGFSWVELLLYKTCVTVVDVGQGQSVILQGGGKTYLVDCGGDSDNIAADATAETLLSMGISKVDGLILTHLDKDHVGGVENLLTRIQIRELYLPRMADEAGYGENLKGLFSNVHTVGEDISLSDSKNVLTIFAPESYNSGNESSMCILFQTENCDILIPGDRGFTAEQILLKEHALPQLEVLVVGHHGSKYSTSRELLVSTEPEYALISAGEDNLYGHPAQELLERLWEFGCQILCTADYGNIIFRR